MATRAGSCTDTRAPWSGSPRSGRTVPVAPPRACALAARGGNRRTTSGARRVARRRRRDAERVSNMNGKGTAGPEERGGVRRNKSTSCRAPPLELALLDQPLAPGRELFGVAPQLHEPGLGQLLPSRGNG